jgi:hypothetical protein
VASSFNIPFTDLWDRLVSLTPSLLPHFSPLCSRAHRDALRLARVMGWRGDELARTSRPARSRATRSRNSAKGKDPFALTQ